MQKPNFFLIGAPKCGTTSLAAWLAEHPAIFMSKVKEPKYFSSDIQHQKYIDTAEKYAALYADADPVRHLAVGEASTEYLFSQRALEGILEWSPEARIIVCLRNPVTLVHSLHEQMVFDGDEPLREFEEAWRAQFPARDRASIPRGQFDPGFYRYAERCMLGKQLERVYARVPKERVKVVFADDLRADSAAIYREILEFLGVPDDGRQSFPSLNGAKARKYLWVKQVSNQLFQLKTRLGLRGKTGILQKLSEWNRRDRPRTPLTSAQRRMLQDVFAEDIERLGHLTGRDLSHWVA